MTLPTSFPPSPTDFDRPVLIEVDPKERGGRGRWWRPKSAGYTDNLAEAGVFNAASMRIYIVHPDHNHAVDARIIAPYLRAEATRLIAIADTLDPEPTP